MAKRLRVNTDCSTYFLTFVVWRRAPVFGLSEFANVAISALKFYVERQDFDLHGYVIMPDHFHLLLTAKSGVTPGRIVGRLKSYLAHVIAGDRSLSSCSELRAFTTSPGWRLWVPRFDETTIRNLEMGSRCLDYIHQNPVRAGLVPTAIDFPYSSAYYYETEVLRPIDLTTVPLC